MVLEPVRSEHLPPVSEDRRAREVQLMERSFWYRRDLSQAEAIREACEKQAELVGLVRANNAGPAE